jgi:stage III sporulation protein AC
VEKPGNYGRRISRDIDVLSEVPSIMNVDVSAIFQIAGIGIVIAMIHSVLKQMGKEDMSNWVTVIGFVIVMFMVVRLLDDLFQEIKTIFLFQ